MTETLEVILNALRGGMDMKAVQRYFGISEATVRRRAENAGRLDEYHAALKASVAYRAAHLDVEKAMSLAGQGQSFTSVCVNMPCREDALRERLMADGRWVEFHARYYSAKSGVPIPEIDPEAWHEGPRQAILATVGMLDEESKANVKGAVTAVDAMITDAAKLSRLCRGSPRCT